MLLVYNSAKYLRNPVIFDRDIISMKVKEQPQHAILKQLEGPHEDCEANVALQDCLVHQVHLAQVDPKELTTPKVCKVTMGPKDHLDHQDPWDCLWPGVEWCWGGGCCHCLIQHIMYLAGQCIAGYLVYWIGAGEPLDIMDMLEGCQTWG